MWASFFGAAGERKNMRDYMRRLRKTLISDETWIPLRKTVSEISQSPVKLLARAYGYQLAPATLTYNQDGLATDHNCDFINETKFSRAYEAGLTTGSWGYNTHLEWRVFVACWAAHRAMRLEGDFVECGVNRGGLSRAIIEYVDFANSSKHFYLLDTFCGLVEDQISENERELGRESGGYNECYDAVCETFGGFKNVVLIKGVVPDTLPLVKAEQIAYLSIDMNCAQPEIAAGEYFWGKLVPGAVILLDDYSDYNFIEQKRAWDQFALNHDTMVLNLPTGQGIIIKH